MLTRADRPDRPASAASQRRVPAPRTSVPPGGASASRGINEGSSNSPVRSSPRPQQPGWNERCFGFPPSFAPRRPRAGQRTSGRGQAIEHGPGHALRHQPNLQSSVITRHVRPRVARAKAGATGARWPQARAHPAPPAQLTELVKDVAFAGHGWPRKPRPQRAEGSAHSAPGSGRLRAPTRHTKVRSPLGRSTLTAFADRHPLTVRWALPLSVALVSRMVLQCEGHISADRKLSRDHASEPLRP